MTSNHIQMNTGYNQWLSQEITTNRKQLLQNQNDLRLFSQNFEQLGIFSDDPYVLKHKEFLVLKINQKQNYIRLLESRLIIC